MTDLPFKFPVLRIPEPSDGQLWEDLLYVHFERDVFTVGSRKYIEGHNFVGELIFDALGRTWRLNELTDLGFQDRPFWGRVCGHVFRLNDIRYELSEELGMPLAEIKERVLAVITANGEHYSRGEYAIENFDASKSNEELLEEFMVQVRNSERPLELIAVVYFHDLV